MSIILVNGSGMTSQESLQMSIDKIVNAPFYKHANIGISVRNISDQKVIAQVVKDKMLVPASGLKLITTLVGLEILGEDFRFETKLTYDGILENDGTLKGNLYIEGGGDPSLGSTRIPGTLSADDLIKKIVDIIYLKGITCIEGNIVADESIFNSFPVSPSWQWNDLGNYYACGAWGLNINENLYNIYYERNGPIGSMTKIAYFDPYIPNLSLENEVTVDSVNTEDNAYIFGGPYHYSKRVVGTIPQGKTLYKIKGSLPDPPSFFAYRILKEIYKRDMGGHLYKTEYVKDPKKTSRALIYTIKSPPLDEIVKYTNDFSINMYAESILKMIGHKKRQNGSGNDGITAIKEYLISQGIDAEPLHMEDGSGLSARNLISPDFMATFLSRYLSKKNESSVFYLIPQTGERGTVRNVLLNSKAKGKIWLKSGSMDKILTYSGYCKTLTGKLVSFCILLNGSTASKMKQNKLELEKILDSIYRFS